MSIITVISIVMAGLLLAAAVRKADPQYHLLIGLACGAAILVTVLSGIQTVTEYASGLASEAGVANEDIEVLLKAVGIGCITKLAADSCNESGEYSLASNVELAGRICIIIISLPLISRLLDIVKNITGI